MPSDIQQRLNLARGKTKPYTSKRLGAELYVAQADDGNSGLSKVKEVRYQS